MTLLLRSSKPMHLCKWSISYSVSKHRTINTTRLATIATRQLNEYGTSNNSLLKYRSTRPRFEFYNNFSMSSAMWENASSKVEITVKTIKEKETQAEKKAQQPTVTTSVPVTEPAVIKQSELPAAIPAPKKSLGQRIWAELVHYYHGFRLLWIDINVSRKLLWRVLMGKTLTRREHRLLIRTTSDLFRLVPFSVFIIVPFMELLLPLAIKLFPGMLPSTFQTATEKEDKIKQNFKVKLEMAKFLQKTLDEMSVQHSDHRSEEAKEFSDFFQKIRRTDGMAPNADEIIKFSKLFEDEITLDSLTRQQIQALCRVLEVNTIGTTNILLFQLRMKLRSLATDDRLIQKEGIQSLNFSELQSACRARGMRAYGISEEQLKVQLQEWIELSLNEKVPPSLLLLSRALMLPENVPTSDKLKATISALPETVGTQTKAAIGEREGKIDNKTKIEIILEEQRKIKEERAEQKEVEQEKSAKLVAEAVKVLETTSILSPKLPMPEELSSKDFEVLNDALESLSKEKMKLIVEKEEIKDLKEEIADYKEDVDELNEVVTANKEKVEIKESRAAQNLFKKVNSMISKLDTVLEDLEKHEKILIEQVKQLPEEQKDKLEKIDELVHIDELMLAIKQIKNVPDDSKIEQIQKLLGRIDDDQDGQIKVDDVLKVIETIGQENVKLSTKQVNELIDFMKVEEAMKTEMKIEKALSKSLESKSKGTPIEEETLLIDDKLLKNQNDNEVNRKLAEVDLLKKMETTKTSDSTKRIE